MQATLARLPLRKISMNPLGRALACTGNFRNLVDTWNLAAETEGYSDNRSSVMRTARSTHFRRVLLGHNGHLSHKRQRHQTRDGSAHHLRRFPDSWEFSSDIRGPAQLPGAPGGCQAVNWPPSRCVHCAHFGLRFGSYVGSPHYGTQASVFRMNSRWPASTTFSRHRWRRSPSPRSINQASTWALRRTPSVGANWWPKRGSEYRGAANIGCAEDTGSAPVDCVNLIGPPGPEGTPSGFQL